MSTNFRSSNGLFKQSISLTICGALIIPIVTIRISRHAKASPRNEAGATAPKRTSLLPPQSRAIERGMPPLPPSPPLIEHRRPATKTEREARVFKLELNVPETLTVEVGEPLRLMAIPMDADRNPVHGLTAEWQSLSPKIISINSDGDADALTTGVAVLTASAAGRTAVVTATVVPRTARITGRRNGATTQSYSPLASVAGRLRKDGRPVRPNARFAHTVSVPASSPAAVVGGDEAAAIYYATNAVGTPPGKTTPGAMTPGAAAASVETPGSANFSFGLPITGLSGRGLDLNLGLIYNSRAWTKSTTTQQQTKMTYAVDGSWPGPGFRLGFGEFRLFFPDPESNPTSATLIDPNGTRHEMKDTSSNPQNPNCVYDSTDGTFIHATVPNCYGTPIVTYPDGTAVEFAAASGNGAGGHAVTKITDRNGNYVRITYAGAYGEGPRIYSIQDTMGRYVYFYYAANNDLVAITAPGLTGQADRQVMRFYYQDITVNQSGLFQSGTVVSGPSTARVIKYIYLPNATEAGNAHIGYRYDYSAYGMIYQITQFRGMTVSTTNLNTTGSVSSEGAQAAISTYSYPTGPSYLTDAPTYTSRTDDWAGRVSAQPVYGFSVNQATGVSTVTAPDGTISETRAIVHKGFWDDGLITDTIIRVGTTELAHTVLTWEEGTTGANPRLQKTQSTNEALETRATAFTYDPTTNYNNVSVVSERDFAAAGTLGTERRRTETTYVTSSSYTNRRLIHLPSSVKVFAGGAGLPSARTDYAYDETSLLSRSGIIMYTDPATVRGNVTTVTQYKDAANPGPSTTITHATTYDVAGNVLTAQVNCCQQKSFNYSSSYYYAYPTSVTSGSGPTLTTSAAYDFNTGLVATSTDENGQITQAYYNADSLRPNRIAYADGGFRDYHYSDQFYNDLSGRAHYFVNISTRLDAARTFDSYTFYDGRGAVTSTFDNWTQANGWSTQDIEYDVMGRAYRASNPYYCGGYAWVPINPTGFWTTKTFDNPGRVKLVTMPSGDASPSSTTTVQTNYAGTVTTVTDQANKQRRQITDALGRVKRLDEPDDSGNLGLISAPARPTSYEYDALDNLIHITQGTQHRYFKYDSLSRLTHERQVEQDAPYTTSEYVAGNNQWSSKVDYNAQSLVTDAYDARQVNTHFIYDGLNRIFQVTYSNGTPAATYTYDQARPGYFNQGRLTTVTTAAADATPQTTCEYDYDLMGRSTSQREKIGATNYQMGYTYNMAGLLLSETYPSGRVMNYAYDEGGRLSAVSDGVGASYANGFTYAPQGGLSSETFGNGAVHTMSYNSALQPKQVKLTLAGTEQQRFDYAYGKADQASGTVDSSKNNGQLGRVDSFINSAKQWDQRFTYDSLGRLSQSAEYRGDNGAQTYQAHYDFDRWGNRFQYQQNTNLAYTPVQTSDVDAARNRLIPSGPSPTTYDAAGNVTTDSKFRGMNYSYDANSRQTFAERTDHTNQQTSVYDAAGQRVQTTANSKTRQMIYDIFGQIIAEHSNGSLERENIYRGGQLLASASAGSGSTSSAAWSSIVNGIDLGGGSLRKTSPDSLDWWNCTAIAQQQLLGSGYFEATPASAGKQGITMLGSNGSLRTIYIGTGSWVGIYEDGNEVIATYGYPTSPGTHLNGDRYRIEINGATVTYVRYRAGVRIVMYVSTAPAPAQPLTMKLGMAYQNAEWQNAIVGTGTQTNLTIANYGFESPAVGAGNFQYTPSGGSWTFTGGAGVSANGSGFTSGNPAAPEGNQVCFLQVGNATITQAVNGFQAGTVYTVTFAAAQRGNANNGGQDFQVYLDNNLLGTFRPTGTNYVDYVSDGFITTAGTHTLKFVGLNSSGGDNTAFVDNVRVSAAGSSANLAIGKPATQTDDHAASTSASKAVDGNTDGALWNGYASATNYHANSWWQVDLQSVQPLTSVQIWGRTDCCSEMTTNFYVFVSDNPFTSYDLTTTLNQAGVSNYYVPGYSGTPGTISVNRTGRYVRVQFAGSQYLVLGEVKVWSAGGLGQNVSWTNTVGVAVSGNNLTKSAGDGWGNGGAASTQSIASGDGYVEFTASETNTHRMCGLSQGDSNQSYTDIDFALYAAVGGVLQVYEAGVYRGQFGSYAGGDRLRVAVEGGVVKYRKNGTLLYTSGISPTYPLLVDTSLYSSGATLTNVVLSGGSGQSSELRYVLSDIRGSTRVVMSGSQIVARHDFLPFGEEISASTGMRTTTQGYGASDTIRQRYGLTERDDTTGLDHTWFRKYENTAGRWTSPDPLNGGIENPQSLNHYSYSANDPVNELDPTGLKPNCDGPTGTDPATGEAICLPILTGGVIIRFSRFDRIIDSRGANQGVNYGALGQIHLRAVIPQNPTPTDQLHERAQQLHGQPNRNDCLALVDLIRTAANLFPNVISATAGLGVVLTGAGFYELALRTGVGHNVQPQVGFGNNGFLTALAGVPGDNQVRHFIGGLLVGQALGAGGVARMNAREVGNGVNEVADRNLNGISVPLGAELQRFNGEYGLTPGLHQSQKLNELADAVKDKVCQP